MDLLKQCHGSASCAASASTSGEDARSLIELMIGTHSRKRPRSGWLRVFFPLSKVTIKPCYSCGEAGLSMHSHRPAGLVSQVTFSGLPPPAPLLLISLSPLQLCITKTLGHPPSRLSKAETLQERIVPYAGGITDSPITCRDGQTKVQLNAK